MKQEIRKINKEELPNVSTKLPYFITIRDKYDLVRMSFKSYLSQSTCDSNKAVIFVAKLFV